MQLQDTPLLRAVRANDSEAVAIALARDVRQRMLDRFGEQHANAFLASQTLASILLRANHTREANAILEEMSGV